MTARNNRSARGARKHAKNRGHKVHRLEPKRRKAKRMGKVLAYP